MLNLFVQIFGLAGFLLLTGPAWYIARYAKAANALAKLDASGDPVLADVRQAALDELTRRRDEWTRPKEYALKIGTLLAIASYGLGLLVAIGQIGSGQ